MHCDWYLNFLTFYSQIFNLSIFVTTYSVKRFFFLNLHCFIADLYSYFSLMPHENDLENMTNK